MRAQGGKIILFARNILLDYGGSRCTEGASSLETDLNKISPNRNAAKS